MGKAFAVYVFSAMRGGVSIFAQIHTSWLVIIQLEFPVLRLPRAKP